MKFELKYPDADSAQSYEIEHSFVTKDRLGQCVNCSSFTRWLDVRAQKHICSEECASKFWDVAQEVAKQDKFDEYRSKVESELQLAAIHNDKWWKDIIIVVRDQLSYFRTCIESIREHTKNYNLLIWDNASGPETKKYLNDLQREYTTLDKPDWTIEVWQSETNQGFIEPNNILAEAGMGDYIIPLNSDTKVFKYWDTAMVAFLESRPKVAQVGYWGGYMDDTGRGSGGDNGYEIDYIPGWCFCISRETYDQFGLFNKQLKFAYCEDGDLSLRLKEAGKQIYALHAPLVYHYQNKTITAVEKEGEVDVRKTFEHNHLYLQNRWKDYLDSGRVLARKGKDSDEVARQIEHISG